MGRTQYHGLQQTAAARPGHSLWWFKPSIIFDGEGGGDLTSRVLYSQKYWWELNLAVGFQIAIANILADLNLVVRYGITIRIYICE